MDRVIITFILLNFMLISLTALFSLNKFDLFTKQLFFWAIGLIIYLSSFFFDFRFIFEKYFYNLIIILSFIILFLVLFTSQNLKSWFNLYGFGIQPSEFAKLGFFLIFARFLSYYKFDLINPFYLFLSFFVLFPYLILILFQPDWGMAFLYFLIWLFSIISFVSKKEIFYGILIIILVFSLLWFFILKDYQKARIISLINPSIDPLKSGYNLRQIKISLGTSSFLGKGVGLGEIGRLGFLPSAFTDFILTFLVEERGIVIFIFYSFLLFLLLKEISKIIFFSKDPLVKNFSFIVYQYFLAKYLITSLVNFGIFPIIGLPVPFLSYGGSYLIFDLTLLAILQSLSNFKV